MHRLTLARLAAAVWALFIAVALALSRDALPDLSVDDKLAHGALFFVFGLLLMASVPGSPDSLLRRGLLAWVLAVAYGALTEAGQLLVFTSRRAEVGDFVADAAGAAAAVLLAVAWRALRRGPSSV